jgi:hypothetical protein
MAMSSIITPLATLSQIEQTPSNEDGIPSTLEDDLRTLGCQLIQQAGVLLKQYAPFLFICTTPTLLRNQVAMSAAQALFQRFWFVSSMKYFGVLVSQDESSLFFFFLFFGRRRAQEIGMGALYLASKLEECTLRLRDLVNIYDLLLQRHEHELQHPDSEYKHTPMSYWSQTYYDLKDAIVVAEMQILKRLGFDVQVKLPYGTLVNYLQVLALIENTETCQRAWAFLNDA